MSCWFCGAASAAHRAHGYGIAVCEHCWARAADGWPKDCEDQVMRALAAAGLLIPDRNEAGRLPRAYQPPADFNL